MRRALEYYKNNRRKGSKIITVAPKNPNTPNNAPKNTPKNTPKNPNTPQNTPKKAIEPDRPRLKQCLSFSETPCPFRSCREAPYRIDRMCVYQLPFTAFSPPFLLTTFPLPFTAIYCLLTAFPSHHLSLTFHCLPLPFIALHCLSLACTAFHCLSLPCTAFPRVCVLTAFIPFQVAAAAAGRPARLRRRRGGRGLRGDANPLPFFANPLPFPALIHCLPLLIHCLSVPFSAFQCLFVLIYCLSFFNPLPFLVNPLPSSAFQCLSV